MDKQLQILRNKPTYRMAHGSKDRMKAQVPRWTEKHKEREKDMDASILSFSLYPGRQLSEMRKNQC